MNEADLILGPKKHVEMGGIVMKAGRELDALIAEKVMGFRYITLSLNDEQHPLVPPEYTGEELRAVGRENTWWWGKDLYFLVPHYSTQIADAKLVWEKMQDSGYCVEMFYDMIAWSVCFMHIDGDEKHYADWKNSLETQVCLAALKAFGHE